MNVPTQPRSHLLRPSSLALALEPRMMFDAAAVATGNEMGAQANAQQAAPAHEASPPSADALPESRQAAVANTDQAPSVSGDSTALERDRVLGYTYDPDTSTNVIDGARDTVASSNGKFVYVLSSPASGVTSISVFSRDAQGQLERVQTLYDSTRSGGIAGLAGAMKMSLSTDQHSLYVVGREGETSNLVALKVDTDTGRMSLGLRLQGDSTTPITSVTSQGDKVFVGAGNSLQVYQQQGDAFRLLHTYTDKQGGMQGLNQVNQVLVSVDGKYLFVGAQGEKNIATALKINPDGSLSLINSATGSSDYFITARSLSADGKSLYALNTDTNQTLEVLSIDSEGRLSAQPSVALNGAVTDMVVAADGSAVFLVGSTLEVFTRHSDGSLGSFSRFNSKDSDNALGLYFNNLDSIGLSADGKQLYITGNVGGERSVLTLNLGLPDATYTEGSNAVALLPSGKISDPQLDAKGNYQGASLVIGRQTNAQNDDTYGLVTANGLSLRGNQIFKADTAIASFEVVQGVLTVKFISAITQPDAQQVLRQITYLNTSQDPTRAGAAPKFAITLNDDNGNSATVDIKVKLIGVNDPAILVSTPVNPTYAEHGDYVKLFQNTRIETIEADQPIWRVKLAIEGANLTDVLKVGTAKLLLDKPTSGAPPASNGMNYSVDISNGVTTVTLYLMKPATEVAALIDGITYGNSANGLSGSRSISLSVDEFPTGESTTLIDKTTITLAGPTATNTAPVLGSIPATTPYVERAEAVLIAPDAVVTDRQMDSLNGGQGNYDGAILTISLGTGATSLDKLAIKPGNGLSLDGINLRKDGAIIGQVSNANGELRISFSDGEGGMPTTADVQNVLRQITYASDSHSPAANVILNIALADRALNSEITRQTIAVQAVNDSPVLNTDPRLSQGQLALLQSIGTVNGLGPITHAGFSSDGRSVYVNDGKGAIALFSRNGNSGQLTFVSTLSATQLDQISQMTVSLDGSKVYVLGQRMQQGQFGANLIPVLTVFARDASSGELTLSQQLLNDTSTGDSLYDAISVAESSDGRNLYVLTQQGLSILRMVDGHLVYLDNIGSSAWDAPYQYQAVALITTGDYVFVVTDPGSNNFANTLIAYKRGNDGRLSVAGYVRDTLTDSADKTVSMADPKYLAISADGSTLYVAGASSVQQFQFNSAGGTFQSVGDTLTGLANISDMRLSSDGALLYVSSRDGSLSRYNTADRGLVLFDRLSRSNAGQVLVSRDGGVILLGNDITVLRAQALPAAIYIDGAGAVVIGAHLTLSDAELDAANNGAGNYQGASIVLERSPAPASGDLFGFADNNGIRQVNGQLLKGGQVIGTFVQANGSLTLSFTASVSSAEAKAVLTHLTYANTETHTAASTSISLSLRLNDGSRDSSGQLVSVEIRPPASNLPPVAAAEPYTPPTAEAGRPYSVVLPANLFSDPDGDPLTWSIAGLPSGLNFDTATRTLSGTPTHSGALTLTLTATDPSGDSVTRSLSLTIKTAIVVQPGVEPTTPGTVSPPDSVTPVVVTAGPIWQSTPQDVANPTRALPRNVDNVHNVDNHPLPQARPVETPHWVGLGSLNGLVPGNGFSVDDSFPGSQQDGALRDSDTRVRQAEAEAPTLSVNRSTVAALLTLDSGTSVTRFQLPEGLFNAREGKLQVSLRLANGLGLPSWIRFDSHTGQMQLDNKQLASLERVKLVLVARDADDHEVRIPVDLTIQHDGSASLETTQPSEDKAGIQASLSSQLQASGQSGLLARGQALLKALLGG